MTNKIPMLSPRELADLLAVPIGTVYSWNASGDGPPYSRVGKHARYRLEDVEAWLTSREVRHA